MLWLIAGAFSGDFQFFLLAGEGVLPCQLSSLFEPDFRFIAINSNGFFVLPVHSVRNHL
jgi:hypothetical protein